MRFPLTLFLVGACSGLFGQYEYGFINAFDQRFQEKEAITVGKDRVHTGVKPLRKDDVIDMDSLNAQNPIGGWWTSNVWGRKMFNERLVQVDAKGFKWRLDPIMNFSGGREFGPGATDAVNYVNTRGFLMEGSFGEEVSFFSTFRENQALYPSWIDAFVQERRVVPGQGESRAFKEGVGIDFNQAMGAVNYRPSDYFNFTFGHGKNFIGEGHRSLFLSDNAFSYPFLRIETTAWKIKYVNLFNYMTDVRREVSGGGVYKRKYVSMHYLSINLGKRWNIGFFEGIVWADSANSSGFDINFLNPIIFYRPIEFARGSDASNALLGFSASYLIRDRWQLYMQFMLDEFVANDFTAGNGSWTNKYALQIGTKAFDVFDVKNLFGRFEFNMSKPYIYSHKRVLTNYGHYNQELAHPWGGNFYEFIGQIAYDYKRFGWESQFTFGLQGNDIGGYFGRGIYSSYDDRPFDDGHFIARFDRSEFYMFNLRSYWMVNPAIRLRLELAYTYRGLFFVNEEVRAIEPNRSGSTFQLALRTQLFNHYYDF